VSKKGNITKVVLSEYKNLLVKGHKNHTMKDKPVNFIKTEVYDLEGNKIYKNDLLICVSGKNRNELSPKEVYDYYKSRFDIEHFFKFAKSKLRFDKFQTTAGVAFFLYFRFKSVAKYMYKLLQSDKTHFTF
jgi:IS4 transposase